MLPELTNPVNGLPLTVVLTMSGPPPNRMAVPPKLLMVPALVRVSVPVIDATVVVPLVNPELIATALPPKNDCTVKPPVLCPELIPVALPPLDGYRKDCSLPSRRLVAALSTLP